MENIIKSTALSASRLLLMSLASVLLKCGVTWKEFSDLSKWVFVDVASNEFGIKGRPTNVSRVSILTGISRKEVKRQRELDLNDDKPLTSKTTDAARLLFGWYHDPEFLDEQGQPKVIRLDAGNANFATLHNRYGGDVPMQTMLKELVKTGSVNSHEDSGHQVLTVQRSYFMPQSMDKNMLLQFGQNLADHAETLNVNVTNQGTQKSRFEGVATVGDVDKKYEKNFYDFVETKGQVFLDEIDAWLSERRVSLNKPKQKSVRLGVGAYSIRGKSHEEFTK